MIQQQQKPTPSDAALIEQLSQLNQRARWYSTQLWALPLTYIGGAGALIGNFTKEAPLYCGLALTATGLIGIAILGHLDGISDGEARAVENLAKTEEQLNLFNTVKYAPKYTTPLKLSVRATTILLLAAGFITLGSASCEWQSKSRTENRPTQTKIESKR